MQELTEEIWELEDSDTSGSSDESGRSFFIMNSTSAHFCGEQQADEDLDLHKGWLLDPQYACDIACNPELIVPGSLHKSQNNLRLATNAGVLMVNEEAKIPGNDNEIWFSEEGIANVLSFKHTLDSSLNISYNRPDKQFVLARKEFNGHPDMVFRMHDSGLHYWEDPLAFCMLNTT